MGTREQRADADEWVGGMAPMPAVVREDGDEFVPTIILWLDGQGAIVGTAVTRPDEVGAKIADSLIEAMQRPMMGPPRRPRRLRVATEAWVAPLQTAFPDIAVRCAPTPEFDHAMSAMRESFVESAPPYSYVENGATPAEVAELFKAAAAVWRAAPWTFAPRDLAHFAVRCPDLDLHDAVLVVIGQDGESYGLVLFEDFDTYDAFLAASEEPELGPLARSLRYSSLNFDPGAELDDDLRKEVSRHGWEVAAAGAYPILLMVEEGLVQQQPRPRDVAVWTAMAGVLASALDDREVLEQAWTTGRVMSAAFGAGFQGVPTTVELSAPHPAMASGDRSELGVALAMVEAGRKAGYDMDTAEGMEAWVEAINDGTVSTDFLADALDSSLGMTPRVGSARSPADRKKRRAMRKAAKKSRRKNRR